MMPLDSSQHAASHGRCRTLFAGTPGSWLASSPSYASLVKDLTSCTPGPLSPAGEVEHRLWGSNDNYLSL